MTPFGARLRELRASRDMPLKQLAERLQISQAYLSALEHGRRGAPGSGLVHQVCDAAEESARLPRLAHPRVVGYTAGLSPAHTALANRLAQTIARLPDGAVEALHAVLDAHPATARPRR